MYKVKIKKAILTITVFATCLLIIASVFSKYSYAEENRKEVAYSSNVKLSTDTKETTSKDTEEIVFRVQDNPNVAKGKMAPGTTATANMEFDLTEMNFAVDFNLQADTSKLPNDFKLTAKIDDESYEIGETKVFDEKSEKKTITLFLTWEDTDSNSQNEMAIQGSEIVIPITWTVEERI